MRSVGPPGLAVVLLLMSPGVAVAYIGPGAGITVIGTAIALLGAILLAIVGFVWYPIKRLRAKLRDKKNGAQADEAPPPS